MTSTFCSEQTIHISTGGIQYEVINPNTISFEKANIFKKIAEVKARPAKPNECVFTIAEGILETKNVAKFGDYIVTNPSGEEYIISGEELHHRYHLKPGTSNTYVPVSPPVRVVFCQRPVAFKSPWGETMFLKAGGALVEHPNGCYGIQPELFAATYQPA